MSQMVKALPQQRRFIGRQGRSLMRRGLMIIRVVFLGNRHTLKEQHDLAPHLLRDGITRNHRRACSASP